MINNAKTRLEVEYVSGSSSRCFHVTISKVTTMWPLTDEKVLQVVTLAGLGCGQVLKITSRDTILVPDDEDKKLNHKYFVYYVRCECDSGD